MKYYTREEMFDEVTATLSKTGDKTVPAGFEKVSETLIDANMNGIYEAYREYKNGDDYWVSLYFTDTRFNVYPAKYNLIDNPETQECLLAVLNYEQYPIVFIKETVGDKITYKALRISQEKKEVAFTFGEDVVNGVKVYYDDDKEITEEKYKDTLDHFTFGHFHDADDNLIPESFRMVWQKPGL